MTNFLRAVPVQQWVTYRAFRGLLRAIFNWRTARRVLLTSATLVTLIAVLYAVENWRGRHAWEQVKRELEAKGERLDLAAFIPPPIPDEQNFAMAPVWAKLNQGGFEAGNPVWSFDTNGWFHLWPHAPASNELKAPMLGGLSGKLTDLASWQKYYRDYHAGALLLLPINATPSAIYGPDYDAFPIPQEAGNPAEDVLIALGRFDEALAGLREAARRPQARFPIHYEDGMETMIPHLGLLKTASDVLHLRAAAELELGRTDAAFEDVNLIVRLMNAIESEPTLISHLVRHSICEAMLSAIWEGTAQHRWTDAHLAAFQNEFQKLDFLADFDAARTHERNLELTLLSEIPALRSGQKPYYSNGRPGGSFSLITAMTGADWLKDSKFWAWTFRLAPRGVFERNKIACVASYQSLGSPRRSASTPFVVIEDWRRRCETLLTETSKPTLDSFLGAPFARWQPEVSLRFFKAETLVRLARIACGLERYRLAVGRYPEHLAELSPRFLATIPSDVIDGGAFKYQRTDDGRCALYSLGWNGQDDGGETGNPKHPQVNDPKAGDWVWKYPAE